MDYSIIKDIHTNTNEILANQRKILDFINKNGQMRQNPPNNQSQQHSFSTNAESRFATPMPKMLNNTSIQKDSRNDGNENHLSAISRTQFNNFQTPNQSLNLKPTTVNKSTTVPRSQANANPVPINFLEGANKSAPKKASVFLPVSSSANPRANLTLDTIAMKKTLLDAKMNKQEFDRNITVTSTPKRKIQEISPAEFAVPSEKRKPGRPPKSAGAKPVNRSSIVHQVKTPSVVGGNNNKTAIDSSNSNKTLGSHLGIKTLLKCQICDVLVDTSAISEMVSHVWNHIIEKAKNAKEVNSFYCETPECEFATNSHDEMCFHYAESKDHNIVDNRATADEYFKHSLVQCFDDLNQKLAQNIYNLRHRRQTGTKK